MIRCDCGIDGETSSYFAYVNLKNPDNGLPSEIRSIFPNDLHNDTNLSNPTGLS